MLANCESVDLVFADVVCLPGDRIQHVYFPTDSFISLVAPIDGYAGLEVGMVGSEGMLGVDVSPLHALVQGAGPALRMNATRFRRQLASSLALRQGLNRYVYVLIS